jgi:hypothetical protein
MKLILSIVSFLLLFFTPQLLLSQHTCYISGNLKGLGTGTKVYLGNKPNGIGPAFQEKFYDSTYSLNDSFSFAPIKFSYVSFYSIETEKRNGW